MRSRTIAGFFCALLSALLSSGVQADLVTMGFDSIARDSYFENRTVDGFRISPACHFDILHAGSVGNALAFDTSGCGGNHFNTNYLGTNQASSDIYIDLFGRFFDVKSLDIWGEVGTVIRSSKGGVLTSSVNNQITTLFAVGDEWSDVQWIEISGGCAGEPCRFVDNIAFDVSSPGTLPLVAIGGFMLFYSRSRRLGRL